MATLFASQPLQSKIASDLAPEPPFEGLRLTSEQRKTLLQQCAKGVAAAPGLHFDTVKHRRGPSQEARENFRLQLLNHLRQGWKNPDTEAQFIKLADSLGVQGCALFAGLIDVAKFGRLIKDYEAIQKSSGSKNFLHSYVNLANGPEFIKNSEYNDAFVHPLLVALIAYRMGGALRIIDTRGKDTEPMSANAQDNMLHIDNTPFHDEYKVLVVWKRGEAKGPSGQNFTYLPGTHQGNRNILVDKSGMPFSTERENLFGSDEALDGLFAFQEKATGKSPTVIEVEYPEQPLSILFAAGALVHHRYRTKHGDPRSCMTAAFHLASDNPGALVRGPHADKEPTTLVDFLIRHQGSGSDATFLDVLSTAAERVEVKIAELLSPSGTTTLVDTSSMTLSEEQLQAWRQTVVTAPSASSIKFSRDVYVSDALGFDKPHLIANLVSAMMYDKHGLLQLILYEDGRDETRKLSRKCIGEMRQDEITSRLAAWLPTLGEQAFTAKDIPDPAVLRDMAESISAAGTEKLKTLEGQSDSKANGVMLASLVRLISDLGEAVERCERPETYASTSLYLFWAADDIAAFLDSSSNQQALSVAGVFLRNYVAFVLLLEAEQKAGTSA
ncbi:hypothetical protein QQX98_005889 [Neonectria punicea]|uniref:Uncharacterized protein n=1 Tax=Neonectria punicea TaxID=979145 RepID=A0ABR1H2X8_9HYPO